MPLFRSSQTSSLTFRPARSRIINMENNETIYYALQHGADVRHFYTVASVEAANFNGDLEEVQLQPMYLDKFDLADMLEQSNVSKSVVFDSQRQINLSWSDDNWGYVTVIDLDTLMWLIESELIF